MVKYSDYFHSMYVWTIIPLVFLAVVASYSRGAFPANLLIAILTASILDILVKKLLLKKKLSMPFSAVISGLIIGSIAPFDASALVVIVACVVAIMSKFLIKLNGHIFNPAALGLLISLSIFSLGDEWWAAGASYSILGYAMTLTPLLILANYRAIKLGVSLPFLLAFAGFSQLTNLVALNSLDAGGLIRFLDAMPYYFAFIMVSEPRTSPYARNEQIIFGVLTAVLSVALTVYSIKYSLFIALLLCNLGYAIYRNLRRTS